MGSALPLLRWAGSKRQIIPVLASYWKSGFSRYVEPFAGSACLFFHLNPRRALLGDVNDELIKTYQHVRQRHPEVAIALSVMKKGEHEYYKMRSLEPDRLTPGERAARFIYLNRYCFNGLYRTNSSGRFNVPYGGNGSGSLPSITALENASRMLRRAVLISGDFELVLDRVEEGDLVYMDPPFSVSSRRVFKEYNASVFGWNDVVRLRQRMDRLAGSNISFVVSYMESEEADYLASGYTVSKVSVRRNISGFVAGRAKCREVLISNLV